MIKSEAYLKLPGMPPRHDHPPAGLELGYAWVSTTKQSLTRQLDALAAAGIPNRADLR
jgi:hypothetical protein